MLDKFNRDINYLRISVTDRCNLKCIYCMPEDKIKFVKRSDILSFEEITEIVKEAVKLGFYKIRLTGGEPLTRKGIDKLVGMIANIKEVKDLSMTTNGILLEYYAEILKKAGLNRLNVSLDTLDPEKYSSITGGGDIQRVLNGIKKAKEVGFNPIKINCVVTENDDEIDAQNIKKFAYENNLEVRFIKQMNIKDGKYSTFKGGSGGECSTCNRLRVTSNGLVVSCLFNDGYFSIKELGIKKALIAALEYKPEKGLKSKNNKFYFIGG